MMAEDKTGENLYSIVDDHQRVIQEKIKSAFMNVSWSDTRWLIQFWAPVIIGRRQLLTSFQQPFATSQYPDPLLQKYRLLSQRYAHSIDDHVNQEEEDDPMIIIIGGPVATAFLNNFLEVVPDMRKANDPENPLVHSALECNLTSSLFLPVFYRHPSSEIKNASCVGVIECSTTNTGYHLVIILNELKSALERVGLNMFHVQQCRPYKTISSLKRARDEIEEALAVVCQSHNLILAQVWIPYENENHDHVSSLRDTQREQTFAVKLIGYHTVFDDEDLLSSTTPYHDTCDMFPLKMGEGLVGKTLQTYETHFCRNIGKLSDNRLLMLSLPANNNVSCLTICLKSNHTGNLDYGFEFLWHQSRNYHLLLRSLLITLERFLPTFTFAFGAKLGDELCFLAVDNSERSMIRCSCNSNGNKLSPLQSKTSSTPLLREEGVNKYFRQTIREATKDRYEWQGRNFPRRKLSAGFRGLAEFGEDDSSTSSSCSSSCAKSPDIVSVMFKAEYGDDLIAFTLPISSATIVAVEKQISDKFEVNRPYELEYLDYNNAWILMDGDADVRVCIKHRNVNSTHIRLRVTNNC